MVLLPSALDQDAVLARLPLLALVNGVQVPPTVANDPAHVSFPAAAMVALASTMRTAAARLRVKLVTSH